MIWIGNPVLVQERGGDRHFGPGQWPTDPTVAVVLSCRSVVAQCEVLRIAARVAVQIKDRALAAEATVGWPHFGDATGNFVFKNFN